MNKNEAIAITNNTVIITQSIQRDPQLAVAFVKSLLLNDPIELMRQWKEAGNYLPFADFKDGALRVYMTLDQIKRDVDKMYTIRNMYLDRGRKVDAIRQVREWTGPNVGLKDAKDFVESL